MRSVLVTRPQPAADELADKLRREGFEVYVAPMTEYVEIPSPPLDAGGCQALLFTSAQAVNIFSKNHDERIPYVFAVGEATAQAASRAGFQRVYAANGSGEDVVALIRSKKGDLHLKKILHPCGEDTAQDVAAALEPDGVFVESVPIYKASFTAHIPPDTARALGEGDITTVTLFSARTAANFARILREEEDLKGVSADLEAVCLSDRVAAEIKSLPWRAVVVAKNAHLESVLDILRAREEGRTGDAPLPADPVIEAFGGLRPLANRLDITASTVQGWKKRGIIPETRVPAVVAAAQAANIDLDSLWRQSPQEKAMAEEDKGTGTGAEGAPGEDAKQGAKPKEPDFHDRRRSTDRRQKRALVDRRGVVHADTYTGQERRSGLDRRSYEQRQHERIVKEKWRFVNRSIVVGSLFSIAVLYVGAFLMAPDLFKMKKESDKILAMQAQIAALQQQQRYRPPPPAPAPSLGSMINKGVNEFQNNADSLSDTAQGISNFAKGAIKNTDTGKIYMRIAQVFSNLSSLNSTAQGRQATRASLNQLIKIMNFADGDTESLKDAIAAARKKDPTLDRLLQGVDPKDVAAAAMLLALTEFRNDVDGGRSFKDDLTVLQKFAGDDPKLQQSLARLAPYAESGVMSRQGLQKAFGSIAMDIVMAKYRGENLDVQAQVMQRLSTMLKVRRTSDIQGNDVDAVVARAKIKIDQGDINGAIADLNQLQGAPAETAQPWMNEAQGRAAADDVGPAILDSILQQIQANTGFDIKGALDSIIGPLKGGVQSPYGGGGGQNSPYVSPATQGGGDQ